MLNQSQSLQFAAVLRAIAGQLEPGLCGFFPTISLSSTLIYPRNSMPEVKQHHPRASSHDAPGKSILRDPKYERIVLHSYRGAHLPVVNPHAFPREFRTFAGDEIQIIS